VAATSDPAGVFALASASTAPLVARIDEPTWLTILEGVVGQGVEPAPVLVVAAPAIQLAGRVQNEQGQALAANLRVVWPADLRSRLHDISDSAFEPTIAANTAAEGAFALTAGAVRGAELLVVADGYVPHRRPLPLAGDTAMAIVLEHLAGKPGTLQGQVVDPHGRAVPKACIGLGAALARSDELGNFTIADDGRSTTLAASAMGHRRGALARGAAFPPFVLLTLGPPPLSIAGRVVDAEGRGLAGIVVWVSDPTILCASREPIAVEGVACGNATAGELRQRFESGEFAGKEPQQVLREIPTAMWPWVRTDASGAFELGGLEERAYTLRALDNATLLMEQSAGVVAGRRDVQLVLDESQLFGEVKGQVVARSGVPVAGARILVQIDALRLEGSTMHERAVATAVTDAEGRFVLPRVPKANAYFRIDGDSILPSEPGRGLAGGVFELAAGRPLELRLEVSLRLHVQVELLDPTRADAIAVLDGDGKNVMLTVFRGRGRSDTDELALAAGRSPVFVVPEAAATLVLRKAGQEVARAPLQLRAGDVNTVRL
jgi:hypothetical protein